MRRDIMKRCSWFNKETEEHNTKLEEKPTEKDERYNYWSACLNNQVFSETLRLSCKIWNITDSLNICFSNRCKSTHGGLKGWYRVRQLRLPFFPQYYLSFFHFSSFFLPLLLSFYCKIKCSGSPLKRCHAQCNRYKPRENYYELRYDRNFDASITTESWILIYTRTPRFVFMDKHEWYGNQVEHFGLCYL